MNDKNTKILWLLYRETSNVGKMICAGFGALLISIGQVYRSSPAGAFGVLFIMWALVWALTHVVINKRMREEAEL